MPNKNVFSSTEILELCDSIKNIHQVLKTVGKFYNEIDAIKNENGNAFFNDFKKYHQKVFKEFSEPGEIRDFSMTRKLLETGVQQEVFRDDLNIEIVNRTLQSLFDLFGHNSEMVDAGFDRKDMFDHILVPFFRGISTKKGRKLLIDCRNLIE